MFEVREESPTLGTLEEYGGVPNAFRVESRFSIESVRNGLGGWVVTEEAVQHPWTKDYDLQDEERPVSWPKRFDICHWGVLSVILWYDAGMTPRRY